jgi:hypothetical protein
MAFITALISLFRIFRDSCFFHKWEVWHYNSMSFSNFDRPRHRWYEKTRICGKCYKKQTYLTYPGRWVDTPLSTQEERDKKINELGI